MHSRQANDAATSGRSIFSKNHDYNIKVFRVAVNTYVYVPILVSCPRH